jgi:hypothetical protein
LKYDTHVRNEKAELLEESKSSRARKQFTVSQSLKNIIRTPVLKVKFWCSKFESI